MFGENGKTKVTHNTPVESLKRVGTLFEGGITLIHRETGDAEIIIDSRLPQELQEVYLEHEQVQLEIIRRYGLRYGESILPKAHFIGLRAGYEKAKELGVEGQYRKHRGERE